MAIITTTEHITTTTSTASVSSHVFVIGHVFVIDDAIDCFDVVITYACYDDPVLIVKDHVKQAHPNHRWLHRQKSYKVTRSTPHVLRIPSHKDRVVNKRKNFIKQCKNKFL